MTTIKYLMRMPLNGKGRSTTTTITITMAMHNYPDKCGHPSASMCSSSVTLMVGQEQQIRQPSYADQQVSWLTW